MTHSQAVEYAMYVVVVEIECVWYDMVCKAIWRIYNFHRKVKCIEKQKIYTNYLLDYCTLLIFDYVNNIIVYITLCDVTNKMNKVCMYTN